NRVAELVARLQRIRLALPGERGARDAARKRKEQWNAAAAGAFLPTLEARQGPQDIDGHAPHVGAILKAVATLADQHSRAIASRRTCDRHDLSGHQKPRSLRVQR